MSLVCSACQRDMGPSESFPGREGTMVYPNVLAKIWVDDESANGQWVAHYVEAPDNIALCFRCIADKLPGKRHPILEAVWRAYEAEIAYQRAEIDERGKWLSPEAIKSGKLFDIWMQKYHAIPTAQCVSCDKEVSDGQNPYFTARVIDKVYCEQHLTQFFGQNYSWSDFKAGSTSFKFCFHCFRANFPSTFKVLGYNLRGDRPSSEAESPKSELYLTSQFIEALRDDLGDEKAQELLANIPPDIEIKLAVDPDSTSKN